jgi:hypothetical protein
MFKNFKFYLLILPVLFISFISLFLLSAGINQVSAQADPKVWVCKYSGTPGGNEFLKPGQQPILVSSNATDGANVGEYFNDAQGRSFVLAIQTEENTGSGNSYIGELSCQPGDIPAPANINPIFECWEPDLENEGRYIAYFGWENKSGVDQTIPYGPYNSITPISYQGLFPTFFNVPTNGPRIGRTPFYPNAAIEISNWDGSNIVWRLTDQGTATAGLKGPRCPEPEPEPIWSITKSVVESCEIDEGGNEYAKGKYTIRLENIGNGEGYVSEVIDELDSKVIKEYLYNISDDGNYFDGKISWVSGEHGWFDAGEYKEFTYELHIPETAYGTYGNTVKAYSSRPDRILSVATIDRTPVATDSVSADLICNYCEITEDVNGEWSDWIIDPQDDTQEMRTRTITEVDVEVNDYICGSRIETEYRDIEEEGDVLGEDDKKEEDEEVLGTSIVYAQTDGGASFIVYIVEFILVILSGIGIKFVGKKYLTL